MGIDITPAASPQDAMDGADVVVCATSAIDPVLDADAIRPGVHYSTIKPAELTAAAVNACDRVANHIRHGGPTVVRTHGIELEEDRKGSLDADAAIGEDAIPMLSDLLTGAAQGRQSPEESTCFLNYAGIGYQFTLVGGLAYEKALDAGLGNELPTDWFTEKEHP